MKSLLFILVAAIWACSSASAQCERCVPPLGDCFDTCFKRLMNKATLEEMVLVMGLKEETAREITYLRDSSSAPFSYSMVAARIDRRTLVSIKESVKGLNETQMRYFTTSPEERRAINDAFEELRLDDIADERDQLINER